MKITEFALRNPLVADQAALRLFEHIDNTTCDQAASPMLVDPAIYSDPDVARLEQDRIFDKVPVLAAHVSELPNAGDFVTIDLPGNRVLVVRQEDGTIRAFVNVCRHRGACLVDEESGHRRVFSCGYHGWAYNCDGALRTVPYADTFGPLDRAEYDELFDELSAGKVRVPRLREGLTARNTG